MRRLLAAALVVLAACDAKPVPSPAVPAAPGPRRLTVAFSGEEWGRFEPCACSPAMLGGLARRKARIDASREPGVPMFVVSGGLFLPGPREASAIRFRAFMKALVAIGVDAFVPEEHELDLAREALAAPGVGTLRTVIGTSAELTSGGAKLAVIPYYRESEIGLAALRARAGDTPAIVLTSLDLEQAREAVKGVAGPTLILQMGVVTDPRSDDATSGSVALAPYPAHGKYVGFAHLSGEGASAVWTVEYRPVVREFPELDAVKAARSTMLAELRDADIVRKAASDFEYLSSRRVAAEGEYAGDESCGACHPEAARVQPTTRHAGAMATLAKTGDDADPECVKCHVVGYLTGRGFGTPGASPSLSHVGCEACHGPRKRHVNARRLVFDDPPPAAKAAASCLHCHDAEHDPDFDFTQAWPKIAHGGK